MVRLRGVPYEIEEIATWARSISRTPAVPEVAPDVDEPLIGELVTLVTHQLQVRLADARQHLCTLIPRCRGDRHQLLSQTTPIRDQIGHRFAGRVLRRPLRAEEKAPVRVLAQLVVAPEEQLLPG